MSMSENDYLACIQALDRVVKRLILNSQLPKIFKTEFGNDVRRCNVEVICYIKCDFEFLKHKTPIYVELECGALFTKPIFLFFNLDKQIIAFKYQYKNALAQPILCKDELNRVCFDYALCVRGLSQRGSCNHPFNPNKFIKRSFEE